MLNDRTINQLRDQHRQDMLHAAESDRLLHEARSAHAANAAQTDATGARHGPVDGVGHRLGLLLSRAPRQEIGTYRLALCHCILEQFRLGAISIEEAEHRLSQLW